MKTGFFEVAPNQFSMMRLLAFLGLCLGGLVALWGLVLLTMVVLAILKGNVYAPQAVGSIILLVSAGLGLAGGGEVMKVVQQRSETKTMNVTEEGVKHEVVVESSGSVNNSPAGGGGL